jgi:uncharacterized protein (TIRG00374 family)
MSEPKSRVDSARFRLPWLAKEKRFPFKAGRLLAYAILLMFAGWCVVTFRADLSRISLMPVWQARDAVLFAAMLSILNYLLRIVRWSAYLKRFGFRFPAGFTALSYVAGFAFTLSPGKVGEMVRARYYKDAGVPLNATTAAFFMERLMDTVAMASLALFGVALSSGYAPILWASFLALFGVLVVLAAMPWHTCQAAVARADQLPALLRGTLKGVLQMLVSARSLLHPRLLAFSFLISLLAWCAEGTGLMVLGNLAPAVPLDWATANGIYAIAVLVGAISFLPGGLGSTEVVMATLLTAHGYAMPQAILITMVCRILTLWLAVVIGWSAVLVLRHYPQQTAI